LSETRPRVWRSTGPREGSNREARNNSSNIQLKNQPADLSSQKGFRAWNKQVAEIDIVFTFLNCMDWSQKRFPLLLCVSLSQLPSLLSMGWFWVCRFWIDWSFLLTKILKCVLSHAVHVDTHACTLYNDMYSIQKGNIQTVKTHEGIWEHICGDHSHCFLCVVYYMV
jgi:hypothetical protein